jgi:2-methylcitrate dehydratase PrpD
MGATTAVSKLLKLDEDKTETALGIAGSMASGLIRNFGCMAGHLHAGDAARNGVEAGILAQKRYTGRHGIVEIPGGFYNIYRHFRTGFRESTARKLQSPGKSLEYPQTRTDV